MIFLYYKIYAYLIHKKNSIKKYKKNIKCNNSFLRNINLILIIFHLIYLISIIIIFIIYIILYYFIQKNYNIKLIKCNQNKIKLILIFNFNYLILF